MKREYNKLVRDYIPQIIEAQGKKVNYRVLNDEEFIQALKQKVIEEAYELDKAVTQDEILEEFADIYTVLSYIGTHYNFKYDDVRCYMAGKDYTKGGFEQRYFLESVEWED